MFKFCDFQKASRTSLWEPSISVNSIGSGNHEVVNDSLCHRNKIHIPSVVPEGMSKKGKITDWCCWAGYINKQLYINSKWRVKYEGRDNITDHIWSPRHSINLKKQYFWTLCTLSKEHFIIIVGSKHLHGDAWSIAKDVALFARHEPRNCIL